MTVGRHWDLRYAGERPMTMNRHRTLHHHARAKVDAYWRETFGWLAREAKIPALRQAKIVALPLHATGRSPQDCGAAAPAVKAAIDGLVDAGVLPDDGPAHLLAITFMAPHVCGEDGLILSVKELL